MGSIRIVQGKYRGRTLKAPEGVETRPLLTRLRKSLADILRPRLPEAKILDLFAGSGAISFELLSGGADSALLIEMSEVAAKAIKVNAAMLGANVRITVGDCLKAIPKLHGEGEGFDIIIAAPPYHKNLHFQAMDALSAHPLAAKGGVAIVQRERTEPFWEPKEPFYLLETRDYGRTVFDFYGVP